MLFFPLQLDICLQQDSAVYKSFRIKGSIGPMRVQLVAEGAFDELRKRMMAFSNTSPNTFKMHRVLRRREYADFLLGKTISWNLPLWRMGQSLWTLDCGERWLKEMSPGFYQQLMNEIMNFAFSNTRKQHFWVLKLLICPNHIYNYIKANCWIEIIVLL